jgi:hypothetical protein
MGMKQSAEVIASAIRFPCPVITLQAKDTKKKCCKKYKKGKRCKRCPNA